MKPQKLKLSEEILIALIRQKHQAGAKAVYEMYKTALLDTITRIVIDKGLSEDVLQETFLKIWQSIGQYDPKKGRLFTWMINIARHLSIDRIRSAGYRFSKTALDLDSCNHLEIISTSDYEKVDRYLIRQEVIKLRQKELEVINLIYYCGFTHVETAKVLNIPLGTVKTRLTVALNRLRTNCSDQHLAMAS